MHLPFICIFICTYICIFIHIFTHIGMNLFKKKVNHTQAHIT